MSLVHVTAHPHAAHVAVLTLDRPEARNGLSIPLIDAFCSAIDEIDEDDDVRVVIVTGADPAFCAGGDIHAMAGRTGEFAGDSAHLRSSYQRHIHRIPTRLLRFDKPVIAAINGPAIGAGLDLACMCDIRIASERARLGSTFVKLGLVPGDGGAYWLARAAGHAIAAELALTGDVIHAETARTYGLVSRVVPHADLLDIAGQVAARIAANGPIAVQLTKAALSKSWDLSAEAALELASTYQAIAQRTEDHMEGVEAFMQRRPPVFQKK